MYVSESAQTFLADPAPLDFIITVAFKNLAVQKIAAKAGRPFSHLIHSDKHFVF